MQEKIKYLHETQECEKVMVSFSHVSSLHSDMNRKITLYNSIKFNNFHVISLKIVITGFNLLLELHYMYMIISKFICTKAFPSFINERH